ncbi:hypothetical protein [Halobacteriovorax sp.]|uniref:hypothetical protein n=1 Tax=Halobacteriovorax sp. TaxID=2020862 RepID=UPI003569D0AC
MKSLITLLALSISISAHAGSANATFTCESASGRTALNASVPGDHAEHNVEFTIDEKTIDWYSEVNQTTYSMDENSKVYVLGKLEDKNYHFIITNTEGYKTLTFSAIPSSIKVTQTEYGEKGSLKAVIIGNDPRSFTDQTPEITVDCSYSYEI